MERQLLEPLLLACAAAAVVLAGGWRPWSGARPPASGRWASALLFAACFAAVWFGFRRELVPFPPREAQHWIFYGTLAALALGALERRRALLWSVGVLALAAATHERAFGALLERRHGPRAWAWIAGLALAQALVALAFRAAAREPARARRAALLAIGTFTVGALVERGTYAGGSLQLGGACFGLGGLLVLSLWRRSWPVFEGAAAPLAAHFAGVLAVGQLSSRAPLGASLAVLALPLVGWTGVRRARAWPLAAAVALALASYALWASWPVPQTYEY